MIILKRWKAILAWAAIDVLVAEASMWLLNFNPPGTHSVHAPEWVGVLFLLIGAFGGAGYCVSTDEEVIVT